MTCNGQFESHATYHGVEVDVVVQYSGELPVAVKPCHDHDDPEFGNPGDPGAIYLDHVTSPAGVDLLNEIDDDDRERLTADAWEKMLEDDSDDSDRAADQDDLRYHEAQ